MLEILGPYLTRLMARLCWNATHARAMTIQLVEERPQELEEFSQRATNVVKMVPRVTAVPGTQHDQVQNILHKLNVAGTQPNRPP